MILTDPHQLPAQLRTSPNRLKRITEQFPMRINTHYLSLISSMDDPIAKQVLPDARELEDHLADPDPLKEESQAPVAQIIHRYPHRVILLVSNQCPVYCRFCMRKRRLINQAQVSPHAIGQGIEYIRKTPQINEVVLSGGDPLMLSDSRLGYILKTLHNMAHVRILRIHTRIPNSWPQRITAKLAAALSAFHPLYINIHFNHPDEISPAAMQACTMLADAGIPLGSQTVMLQGVNDQVDILHRLFQTLLEIRVRPYYVHQLDRVPGTAHFRVPIDKALDLMQDLRKSLSGQAMPHFMVDLPGGGGKVELIRDTCPAGDDGQWVLNSFDNRRFVYSIE
jgi:lysine 2,3-aminomutase